MRLRKICDALSGSHLFLQEANTTQVILCNAARAAKSMRFETTVRFTRAYVGKIKKASGHGLVFRHLQVGEVV